MKGSSHGGHAQPWVYVSDMHCGGQCVCSSSSAEFPQPCSFPAAPLQHRLNITSLMRANAATAAFYQRTELFCVMVLFLQCSWSQVDGSRQQQLLLPRVNGAGHSVVAVVHSVRSPAVAPHTLGAVVSGHSQVLRKMIQNRRDR